MRLALVASAHGFGHVTRQLAVGVALRARGIEPTVFTAAPTSLVEETLPGATVVPWAVDVGLAQRDSLTEDVPATRAALAERASEAALDRLAKALEGFDRVAVDTAPTALEAARRAGVEAVAVGNFDWAWLYRRTPGLEDWADRFAAWQAPHAGLELWPGPGLHGFASVERFGLVARTARPHRLPPGAVLVSFGGFGLQDLDALLPRLPGVTWVLAPPMQPLPRPDCIYAERVPYPALVAGCAAVFTKPGYGILAECLAAGTGIVWADRGAFPEAASLEAVMRGRGDRKVTASPRQPDAFRAGLAAALTARLAAGRPAPVDAPGAAALAARLAAPGSA